MPCNPPTLHLSTIRARALDGRVGPGSTVHLSHLSIITTVYPCKWYRLVNIPRQRPQQGRLSHPGAIGVKIPFKNNKKQQQSRWGLFFVPLLYLLYCKNKYCGMCFFVFLFFERIPLRQNIYPDKRQAIYRYNIIPGIWNTYICR